VGLFVGTRVGFFVGAATEGVGFEVGLTVGVAVGLKPWNPAVLRPLFNDAIAFFAWSGVTDRP